jgi:putative SOS response-associated peptidase YedK
MLCIEMCGRFTLKSPGRIKFARADRSSLPPLVPRYNIAPSQDVLAIVESRVECEAVFLQWVRIQSYASMKMLPNVGAGRGERF